MLTAPFPSKYGADPFGDWPDWRKQRGLGPHRGKDWNGLPAGTPIPASGTGRVTWKTNLTDPESTELGHRIVIGYALDDGRTLYIGYCHLNESPTLNVGDIVGLGSTVGLLGNSGTASTGAHLHQTASWFNGNPGTVAVIDVMPFFDTTTTAGGSSTTITNRKRRRGDEEMAEKYYRKDSTGEIGRFGAGVKIFGNEEDYMDHREAVIAYKSKTPGVDIVIPPLPTKDARNFTNLDDRHWNIEVAVHGGTY